MSRYIDTDELSRAKFHPLPYTHIIPADIKDAEAYERGWNDAIDAIIESAPTADVRENVHAHWEEADKYGNRRCSNCESVEHVPTLMGKPIVWKFCPNCGAEMEANDGEIH